MRGANVSAKERAALYARRADRPLTLAAFYAGPSWVRTLAEIRRLPERTHA